MAEDKGSCGCGEGMHSHEKNTDMQTGMDKKDMDKGSGSMGVEEAGSKGGQRERELGEQGKQEESNR